MAQGSRLRTAPGTFDVPRRTIIDVARCRGLPPRAVPGSNFRPRQRAISCRLASHLGLGLAICVCDSDYGGGAEAPANYQVRWLRRVDLVSVRFRQADRLEPLASSKRSRTGAGGAQTLLRCNNAPLAYEVVTIRVHDSNSNSNSIRQRFD